MATCSGCFRTGECRSPLPRSASSRHRASAHPRRRCLGGQCLGGRCAVSGAAVLQTENIDGGARIEGPAHELDFAAPTVDMLGYEVPRVAPRPHSMIDLPEGSHPLFGCRPDVLSTARIQGHQKYIYHFGNRPGEPTTLRRTPSNGTIAAESSGKELQRLAIGSADWHANHRRLRSVGPLLDDRTMRTSGSNSNGNLVALQRETG